LYDPVNYFYLCLIVVAIALFIPYRIERSRVGLTFHAIHCRTSSPSPSVRLPRILAFVIASFFAGLAGALYVLSCSCPGAGEPGA
jgi:branched-chain amino acid transport system permease protein